MLLHVTPNLLKQIVTFTNMHHHSWALFAPHQCLGSSSAPTSLSSLSAQQ